MTRAEKHAMITSLQRAGLTRKAIAAHLGMKEGRVHNLLNDPDGAKQRARRRRYQGTCETCGAATDGSNGRAKAPRFCREHTQTAVWTRDKVIAAIRRFATTHGRPPTATDWHSRCESGYPATSTVRRVFGSWADGIEAAGFPPPRVGVYQRRARHVEVVAAPGLEGGVG